MILLIVCEVFGYMNNMMTPHLSHVQLKHILSSHILFIWNVGRGPDPSYMYLFPLGLWVLSMQNGLSIIISVSIIVKHYNFMVQNTCCGSCIASGTKVLREHDYEIVCICWTAGRCTSWKGRRLPLCPEVAGLALMGICTSLVDLTTKATAIGYWILLILGNR